MYLCKNIKSKEKKIKNIAVEAYRRRKPSEIADWTYCCDSNNNNNNKTNMCVICLPRNPAVLHCIRIVQFIFHKNSITRIDRYLRIIFYCIQCVYNDAFSLWGRKRTNGSPNWFDGPHQSKISLRFVPSGNPEVSVFFLNGYAIVLIKFWSLIFVTVCFTLNFKRFWGFRDRKTFTPKSSWKRRTFGHGLVFSCILDHVNWHISNFK